MLNFHIKILGLERLKEIGEWLEKAARISVLLVASLMIWNREKI